MHTNSITPVVATIFNRLYDRFSDLIPSLTSLCEGDSFYAASRIPEDMAIYCSVTKVDGGLVQIEIADDHIVSGEERPSPWMIFELDHKNRTAELLFAQDGFRYEVIYSEKNKINGRRHPMNLYAVNWLTILFGIQKSFRPISIDATTTC
jgi:uncharacterized protein YqiB (DUF1249 family)